MPDIMTIITGVAGAIPSEVQPLATAAAIILTMEIIDSVIGMIERIGKF